MLSPPGRSYFITYTIISGVFLPIRHRSARPGQPFSGLLSTLSVLCRLVRHSSAHCICLVPTCPAARLAWHLPAYSIAPRHTLLCTTLSFLPSSASSHAALPALACPFCLQDITYSADRGYRQYANSSADAIVGRLFVGIIRSTKQLYHLRQSGRIRDEYTGHTAPQQGKPSD